MYPLEQVQWYVTVPSLENMTQEPRSPHGLGLQGVILAPHNLPVNPSGQTHFELSPITTHEPPC